MPEYTEPSVVGPSKPSKRNSRHIQSREDLREGMWLRIHGREDSSLRVCLHSEAYRINDVWVVDYGFSSTEKQSTPYHLADMGIEPYEDGMWNLIRWTEEINEPTLENLFKGENND